MATGRTKRNVAIAALAVGLLFLAGAGFDEEPEEPEGPDGPEPPEPEPEGPFIFVPGTFEPPQPKPGPIGPIFPGPAAPSWDPTQWEHPDNYPTHGVFHQVVKGDIFGGKGSRHNMAWAALYEAAYEAATDHGGYDDAQAHVFASAFAGKAANRGKYIDLILCAPSNDLTYGTWGFGKKAPVGPHGRGIRLLRYHPDNRARIHNREAPIRNIEMGEPADKRTGSAGPVDLDYAEEYEYLWLPRLNTRRIWEAGQVTTEGETWADGSSTMLPPPEVWDLGIDVLEDLPIDTFGCLGAEEELA